MSDLPHVVSASQSKLEEDLEHKKRDSDADGLCRSFSLAAEEKTLQAPLEKGTAEGELSPSVSSASSASLSRNIWTSNFSRTTSANTSAKYARKMSTMLHELDLESQGKRYWRKAKAIVHATSMDPRRTSRLNTLNSLGWQAAFRRWTAELATDAVLWMTIAIHTLATLFVFLHHALLKEEQTASKVPQGAPRYWQKRLVPVFEFGAMHALLLQMAILPIVMCSNLLTALRRTPLGVLLPLASSTAFHQHLGAVMLFQLLGAFVVFLFHFGSLCGDGVTKFCDMFTSEIMISGYVILGLTLLVALPALPFIRRLVPFEAFYHSHHLFILLYAATIMHTIDGDVRDRNRERSQAFKWLSGPLVLYAIDKMVTLARRLRTGPWIVMEARTSDDPNRALLLRIKPRDESKQVSIAAGQYVKLRIPQISSVEWHSFSVANAVSVDDYVEIFVEAVGSPTSWTSRLYNLCQGSDLEHLRLDVAGPFGSAMQSATAVPSRRKMLVCTGSGVVPMISLLMNLIYAHNLCVLPDTSEQSRVRDEDISSDEGEEDPASPKEKPLERRKSASDVEDPGIGMSVADSVEYARWAKAQASLGRAFGINRPIELGFLVLALIDAGVGMALLTWPKHAGDLGAGRIPRGVFFVLYALYVVGLASHVVNAIRRRMWGLSELAIECASIALLVAVARHEPPPGFAQSMLLAACCAYRFAWEAFANPLMGNNIAGDTAVAATAGDDADAPPVFTHGISMLWRVKSASILHWAIWRIEQVVSELRKRSDLAGVDFDNAFDFRIQFSSKDPLEIASARAISQNLENTVLSGRLTITDEEPNVDFRTTMRELVQNSDGTLGAIGLFYCGNSRLGAKLRKDVNEHNVGYEVNQRSTPIVYANETVFA